MAASMPSPPHVFVVRGDIRRIACDAWLLPTNRNFKLEEEWGAQSVPASPPAGWADRGVRIVRADMKSDRDVPYLTNVGGDVAGISDVDWYCEGVRQFVRTAAADCATRGPAAYKRERPLLLVPVVGSGHGGAASRVGELLEALLRVLNEEAKRAAGVDLVLVTRTERVFAAVSRLRLLHNSEPFEDVLGRRLVQHARRLAQLARDRQLVLFIGAGVSFGAGLPLWGGLVDKIAELSGCSARERTALSTMDFLDAARIIEGRLRASDKSVTLGELVAEAIKKASRAYSLQHALLASLPPLDAVTTNYDTLFEAARASAGVPFDFVVGGGGGDDGAGDRRRVAEQTFLLKMHGCVERPREIVLSRDDYLIRFNTALNSVVEAKMVSSHLLFTGFSLSDLNFHRIAAAVRSSHGRAATSTRFGTSTQLVEDKLFEELHTDLDIVSMVPRIGEPHEDFRQYPAASRILEILFDAAACLAADTSSFLLDRRFAAVLTVEDRAFALWVGTFLRRVPLSARAAHAWDRILAFRASLGYEPSSGPAEVKSPASASDSDVDEEEQKAVSATESDIRMASIWSSTHSVDQFGRLRPGASAWTAGDDAQLKAWKKKSRATAKTTTNTKKKTTTTSKKKKTDDEQFDPLAVYTRAMASAAERVDARATRHFLRYFPRSVVEFERGGHPLPPWALTVVSYRALAGSRPPLPLLRQQSTYGQIEMPYKALMGAGHLFLIKGDLRFLSADAVMAPSNTRFSPVSTWFTPERHAHAKSCRIAIRQRIPTEIAQLCPHDEPSLFSGERVASLCAWPEQWSPVYLTNAIGRTVPTMLDGVEQFLATVALDLAGQAPKFGRERHLVALPIAGTGAGGLRHATGEVVAALLACLRAATERYGFDCVLVAFDEQSLSMAQLERLKYSSGELAAGAHHPTAILELLDQKDGAAEGWPELSANEVREALRIARESARDELVVFFSSPATGTGCPRLEDVYAKLAEHVLPVGAGLEEEFAELPVREQANVLELKLGRALFQERVAREMARFEDTPLHHALLAQVATARTLTSCVDSCFERAWRQTRPNVHLEVVRRNETLSSRAQWVLKLNGEPPEAVLSRADWSEGRPLRNTLASVVQTLLLSKHLLFVNADLQDELFARALDAVESLPASRNNAGKPALCTLLSERAQAQSTLMQALYRERGIAVVETRGSSRTVDMFLDLVGALRSAIGGGCASQQKHLLDDRFKSTLDTSERVLRDYILSQIMRMRPEATRSSAFHLLVKLLYDLGLTTDNKGLFPGSYSSAHFWRRAVARGEGLQYLSEHIQRQIVRLWETRRD